jgi:hypothetical protein
MHHRRVSFVSGQLYLQERLVCFMLRGRLVPGLHPSKNLSQSTLKAGG